MWLEFYQCQIDCYISRRFHVGVMVTNHKAKTHSGFTKGEENKIRAYHQENQFTKEHSNRVKKKEGNYRTSRKQYDGSRKRLHSNSCSKTPQQCSGQESTCQWRGLGFDDWSSRIPHAAQWLGLSATNTEPTLQSCEPQPFKSACPPMGSNYWACVLQLWNPRAQSLCSETRATTRRSLHTATKCSPHMLQSGKAHK